MWSEDLMLLLWGVPSLWNAAKGPCPKDSPAKLLGRLSGHSGRWPYWWQLRDNNPMITLLWGVIWVIRVPEATWPIANHSPPCDEPAGQCQALESHSTSTSSPASGSSCIWYLGASPHPWQSHLPSLTRWDFTPEYLYLLRPLDAMLDSHKYFRYAPSTWGIPKPAAFPQKTHWSMR